MSAPALRACAVVSGKDGRAHGKRTSGKIRAFLRAVCDAEFRGIFGRKVRSIFKQEKESVPKTALDSVHFGRQRRPFYKDTLRGVYAVRQYGAVFRAMTLCAAPFSRLL